MRHLQTLHTQDNLATADPLFIVFEKDRIYGVDDDDGFYEWQSEDWESATEEERKELEELREKEGGTQFVLEGGMRFSIIHFIERDKFVTACFTQNGAQDYIDVNGHNLTLPFIYVGTLHRNREMIEVRQHLMATHRPQLPWQPIKK